MTTRQEINEHFDQAITAIPSCALDAAGLRHQRSRYARLARSVTRLETEPEAVEVEFAAAFERETLEQALAVERQCCPFFEFHFDEARRRLRITVRDAEQLPALEAMAHSLGTAHRAAAN